VDPRSPFDVWERRFDRLGDMLAEPDEKK